MASCSAPLRAAAPHCRLAWPPTHLLYLPRPAADWRVAGMSYLKYSNLCADMVRSALKEAVKGKAKTREVIYYRSAQWKNGVPEKQGGQRCAGRRGGRAAGRPCGRRWLHLWEQCCAEVLPAGNVVGGAVVACASEGKRGLCAGAAACWLRVGVRGVVLLPRWRGCWPDCLPYTHTKLLPAAPAVITDITEGTAGKLS